MPTEQAKSQTHKKPGFDKTPEISGVHDCHCSCQGSQESKSHAARSAAWRPDVLDGQIAFVQTWKHYVSCNNSTLTASNVKREEPCYKSNSYWERSRLREAHIDQTNSHLESFFAPLKSGESACGINHTLRSDPRNMHIPSAASQNRKLLVAVVVRGDSNISTSRVVY